MAKTAKYTADSGGDYTIQVADFVDLIDNAKTGLAVAAGDPVLPKGMRVRGVFIQSGSDRRKFVPCNTAGTLYNNAATAVGHTIDGENDWTTTGRKGERLSFVSVPSIA